MLTFPKKFLGFFLKINYLDLKERLAVILFFLSHSCILHFPVVVLHCLQWQPAIVSLVFG